MNRFPPPLFHKAEKFIPCRREYKRSLATSGATMEMRLATRKMGNFEEGDVSHNALRQICNSLLKWRLFSAQVLVDAWSRLNDWRKDRLALSGNGELKCPINEPLYFLKSEQNS